MTAMTASGRFVSWPRGGGRMSPCWGRITSSARSPSRTVSGEVAGNQEWQEVDTRPGRLSHCGDFPFIYLFIYFLSDGLLGPAVFEESARHTECASTSEVTSLKVGL